MCLRQSKESHILFHLAIRRFSNWVSTKLKQVICNLWICLANVLSWICKWDSTYKDGLLLKVLNDWIFFFIEFCLFPQVGLYSLCFVSIIQIVYLLLRLQFSLMFEYLHTAFIVKRNVMMWIKWKHTKLKNSRLIYLIFRTTVVLRCTCTEVDYPYILCNQY